MKDRYGDEYESGSSTSESEDDTAEVELVLFKASTRKFGVLRLKDDCPAVSRNRVLAMNKETKQLPTEEKKMI